MRKILAGIEFHTLQSIVEHARQIKDKYRNEETVIGEDDLFLREFLSLHPNSSEKIGPGISSFTVQLDDHWKNSRQFVVVRTDGTRAIFSHNRLRMVPETEEEKARRRCLAAMRQAIVFQIVEFKNKNFRAGVTTCPYTGEILASDQVHVDHEYPQTFLALVLQWLEIKNLKFSEIQITSDSNWRTFKEMTDPRQKNSWYLFHSVYANLRLISKRANLSQARRAP